MKAFIYSLNCPISRNVRYVGKTRNTLVKRLSEHISCSDRNIEKRLWIKSLAAKGLKPTISLLEITDESSWQKRESYWIMDCIKKGIVLLNKVDDMMQKERVLLMYIKELDRQKYRENTKKVYIPCFMKFLYAFEGFEYCNIKHDEIVQYLQFLVSENNISPEHQNTTINAIKFYYEKVLMKERQTYYILRPRKQHKIRPILSPEQVEQFIGSIRSFKQQTLFQVMYSGALRTGEVISLLVADLNRTDGTYFIRDAKGAKDRHITLPEQTISMIDAYISKYNPDKYLFAGQKQGSHYSSKSVQIKFEEKIKELGFNLELTPHCLRHSRISHTLNNGAKLEMVSKHAGHSNVNITSKTYHHYDHEEMRSQMADADKRMQEKMDARKNKIEVPSTIQKIISSSLQIKEKSIGLTSSDKIYNVHMNGKTYLLKSRNDKIVFLVFPTYLTFLLMGQFRE